jgi:hypothetical protein
MNSIEDEIRIKQMLINVENDPTARQELQKQLRKLQLEKEIEDIKRRIDQIG